MGACLFPRANDIDVQAISENRLTGTFLGGCAFLGLDPGLTGRGKQVCFGIFIRGCCLNQSHFESFLGTIYR